MPAQIRRLYRLARLLPHLFVGLWHAATRLPEDPPPRTEFQWRTVRQWHRRLLRLAGVRLRIHGTPAAAPALFAANHVSWLDIGALASVLDAGFIGKRELQHWPVLGFLITRGGTIYIDRGGRGAAANVSEQMGRRLAQGDCVTVFPEGTTTNGADIRRFHPRLFEPARQTGAPVQPIALVYSDPVAAFVEDVPFLRHLWRVLAAPRITVDVWLLPPIPTQGLGRRALARLAEQAVADVVRGIPPTAAASGPEGPTAPIRGVAGEQH